MSFCVSSVQLQIPDFCHQRELLQEYVSVAFGLLLKFINLREPACLQAFSLELFLRECSTKANFPKFLRFYHQFLLEKEIIFLS